MSRKLIQTKITDFFPPNQNKKEYKILRDKIENCYLNGSKFKHDYDGPSNNEVSMIDKIQRILKAIVITANKNWQRMRYTCVYRGLNVIYKIFNKIKSDNELYCLEYRNCVINLHEYLIESEIWYFDFIIPYDTHLFYCGADPALYLIDIKKKYTRREYYSRKNTLDDIFDELPEILSFLDKITYCDCDKLLKKGISTRDFQKMKKEKQEFSSELMRRVFNPERMKRIIEQYGFEDFTIYLDILDL